MLHAVVMAGGSGTRFWPKSRRDRPKQLLRLHGDRTMLQQTVDRIAPLTDPSRTWIITGEDQAAATREQLPGLAADHVVGEPCARDTAACVGLAALLVRASDPDATMVVMPADHVVEPAETFRATVGAAAGVVARSPGTFVTFGIRPTRAETGYGYIERGAPAGEPGGVRAHRVARFREKPDRATAEEFVRSGRFDWNSGIFVWRAAAILDAIRRFEPGLGEGLDRIAASLGTPDEGRVLGEVYPGLPRRPIDKAVMERAEDVQVLEVTYSWNDIGDWRSLPALLGRDEAGNTAEGPALLRGARDCVVVADEGRPVVLLGTEGLVVVQSGGVTLVARADRLDGLKELVEGLAGSGRGDLL